MSAVLILRCYWTVICGWLKHGIQLPVTPIAKIAKRNAWILMKKFHQYGAAGWKWIGICLEDGFLALKIESGRISGDPII